MKAHIIGLGLIGGSIGMALRQRRWQVSFADPAVTLEEARRYGAADSVDGTAADVIILATPVDVAMRLLSGEELHAATITSVCSVLAPLVRAAVAQRGFVAGHPMAGSQERGLGAASATLFRQASWFVTRHDDAVAKVIADCGAFEELVDAGEHDEAMAVVSHLPQILSTALAAHLDERVLRFAGPGLRTFLRLAGSEAAVWRPIIDANRDAIAPHADAVAAIVQRMLDGDAQPFERARRIYQQLSSGRP